MEEDKTNDRDLSFPGVSECHTSPNSLKYHHYGTAKMEKSDTRLGTLFNILGRGDSAHSISHQEDPAQSRLIWGRLLI